MSITIMPEMPEMSDKRNTWRAPGLFVIHNHFSETETQLKEKEEMNNYYVKQDVQVETLEKPPSKR